MSNKQRQASLQFATFYLGQELYGIDVMQVQEVTNPLPITALPLAPDYVKGLINLRGQISTAIGLKELMGTSAGDEILHGMAVVCRFEGQLVSFLVDRIGDVIEATYADFEAAPHTVPEIARNLITGIYKSEAALISVVDLERIIAELNYKA
jgi:purine-binding chemotaxis protein CheW